MQNLTADRMRTLSASENPSKHVPQKKSVFFPLFLENPGYSGGTVDILCVAMVKLSYKSFFLTEKKCGGFGWPQAAQENFEVLDNVIITFYVRKCALICENIRNLSDF